jgi:hypothetical protein
LQTIIVAAGALSLLAVIVHPQGTSELIVFVFCIFLLLFAMTSWLKNFIKKKAIPKKSEYPNAGAKPKNDVDKIIVAAGAFLLLAIIVRPRGTVGLIVFVFCIFLLLFAMTSWLKNFIKKRQSQKESAYPNAGAKPENDVDEIPAKNIVAKQRTSWIPEKEDKSRRLAYVQRTRRSYWFVPVFYIFVTLVPSYYEYKTEIPPDEALIKTEGTFFYRHIGKTGYLVELTNEKGKETFTCRQNMTLGNSHDCLFAIKQVEFFYGKAATVWWFDQEIYPFIHQRRLVRIIVNDRELVSREETIADAEASIRHLPWFAVAFLVFAVFLTCYVEFCVLRRIEKHEQEHR